MSSRLKLITASSSLILHSKGQIYRRPAMSTVSLAVVGGSLVAWQVYTRTATTNKETPDTTNNNFKRKLPAAAAYVYSREPEFILVPTTLKEGVHFGLDPSSDCLKAKGELRSMLKRKQWKLLKAANSEGSDRR